MKLGFRGRLFVSSLALILVVAAISGVFLEAALRSWFASSRERELTSLVRTVEALTLHTLEDAEGDVEGLQARMRSLGPRIGARITVIRAGGRVVADSALTRQQMRGMGDHGSRPEVRKAREEGLGVARRHSDTLEKEMLYVAVPVTGLPDWGFVRVAMAGRDVDAAVRRLRLLIAFGVAMGILVAVGMALLASRAAARSLEELIVKARAISAGQGDQRIEVQSTDELAGLAGSFNKMAADLERVVGELADERNRVEAVLEGLADGVLAVDRTLNITEANPAAKLLLALGDFPRGQPLLEVVQEPELRELSTRALKGEKAHGALHLSGPPERVLEVTATPQSAAGACVLLLRDVTELRRLEAVRRDFVANVSHELRTPISTLCIHAETLLGGGLERPEEARRFVEGMHRNAVRLGHVVHDLLDLSRLEAGRYHLDLRPIHAADVVGAVLDVCEERARLGQLDFDTELEEDLRVQADPKGLEHILTNLVDNAIKYTPAGERIGLRARREGEQVHFEVWDTGPGIEEVHRARLFERFYRVDTGRSRDRGGTGLGLSIVRHLAEAMKGRVGMRPNSEGGSIFWLDLPAPEAAALTKPG